MKKSFVKENEDVGDECDGFINENDECDWGLWHNFLGKHWQACATKSTVWSKLESSVSFKCCLPKWTAGADAKHQSIFWMYNFLPNIFSGKEFVF